MNTVHGTLFSGPQVRLIITNLIPTGHKMQQGYKKSFGNNLLHVVTTVNST